MLSIIFCTPYWHQHLREVEGNDWPADLPAAGARLSWQQIFSLLLQVCLFFWVCRLSCVSVITLINFFPSSQRFLGYTVQQAQLTDSFLHTVVSWSLLWECEEELRKIKVSSRFGIICFVLLFFFLATFPTSVLFNSLDCPDTGLHPLEEVLHHCLSPFKLQLFFWGLLAIS